jgi:site-specific recombinase XerD
MAGMRPPSLEDKPVPVIPDDALRALLKACEGRDFENRRDAALIRVFVDTGIRLGEMADMRIDDLDLDQRVALVTGKGRRSRVVPLGAKAIRALDRYVERARPAHPHADEPWLWLGAKGRMTDSGIAQMLRRRCHEAGIAPIHAHQFRHTFAHAGSQRAATSVT